MSYDLEKYVRSLGERLEALESTEHLVVLCQSHTRWEAGRLVTTWDVVSIGEGVAVDSGTWPSQSDGWSPQQHVWLGTAKVWREHGLYAASATTPSGKRVGVGNQPDSETAVFELNRAIEQAERKQ